MRETVELFLVAFHLFDEVYEMERLLELLEVLSINHVAEFVLNANDELNDVERVETLLGLWLAMGVSMYPSNI